MWTKQNIPPQNGKTVIVTGANSGIGFQSALALYQAGAHVIAAGRDASKINSAIKAMKANTGMGTLEAGLIDLSCLQSIKEFADSLIRKHPQLNLLINNAAVMIPPASFSNDNFELQFAVNFLGHFALTGYLYDLLKSSTAARVITVTSLAYTHGAIDFDNLQLEKEYNAQREYNQSKLANILFAIELQRRIAANGDNIVSMATQPGVALTDLSRNMSKKDYDEAVNLFGPLMTGEQSALSTLYAATFEKIEGGSLYGPDQDGGLRGYPARMEILPNALDKITAEKLWQVAELFTSIKFPSS